MSVGVILNGQNEKQKKLAYGADITYCTNNELGFDYLRDNMATNKNQRVQRGQNFAIVDEVDSILIDEARTPLIISGMGSKSSEGYVNAQRFVKTLKKDQDVEIDEKTKQLNLTESGIEKAERFLRSTVCLMLRILNLITISTTHFVQITSCSVMKTISSKMAR